jgi:hypothetical protein
VKALVTRLVSWLWIDGAVIALGNFLAMIPESWLGHPWRKAREVAVA